MTDKHDVVIADSYDVTNANTTLHTADTATPRTVITRALATNYSGSSATLTVYIDADGTGTANLNKKADAVAIPANTTLPIYEIHGAVVEGGGTITVVASANTAINLSVYATQHFD